MPKSVTQLQNQLSSCERSMQESLSQCAEMVGNQDYKVNFSLKDFVETLPNFNMEEAQREISKMIDILKECDKILAVESKRRVYTKELRKIIRQERREKQLNDLPSRTISRKKHLLCVFHLRQLLKMKLLIMNEKKLTIS